MNLYKQFQTSKNFEVSGVDLNYGENEKGQPILITIGRAGGANKNFQRKLMELSRPHKRAIATETMSPERSDEIMRKVYAETVVLGWSGVTGPNGEDIPFTPAAAEKLFTDLPDLFADIRDQAASAAIFRADVLEAAAKN